MTIAACHLSDEGVVLGANSTTTFLSSGPSGQQGIRHFSFAQKIFEVGEGSSLGVVTWGVGSLQEKSYRTFAAEFADRVIGGSQGVAEIARLWSSVFWAEYCERYKQQIARAKTLAAIEKPSSDESRELKLYTRGISGGFCIAGRHGDSRQPEAYAIEFGPLLGDCPIGSIVLTVVLVFEVLTRLFPGFFNPFR